MMEPKLLLTIGSIYNLGFAVFHLFFWKIFKWKQDLAHLNPVNRSIMQILNLCLTFIFFVMAYVSLMFQSELVATKLGQTLLLAFSLFWFLRMVEQVIFFGIKNKISLALTVLFLLGSLIYLLPVL